MYDTGVEKWRRIGRARIVNILKTHTVACSRTLEQKICDAGPGDMRPNPHHLTNARKELVEQNTVIELREDSNSWYFLNNTTSQERNHKLALLRPLTEELQNANKRTGQCLEVAIFKALNQQDKLIYFGRFDLDKRMSEQGLYTKEEPPSHINNKSLGSKSVDFLVLCPDGGYAAIEAKNVRPWLYPNRREVKDLINKAATLNCVPVLIARRFPYVLFHLLSPFGVILHQTYNQFMHERDRSTAERAKNKNLLGYHDIRIGNDPDKRLLKFIGTNLPRVLPRARRKFEQHKDLLEEWSEGELPYQEFAESIKNINQVISD